MKLKDILSIGGSIIKASVFKKKMPLQVTVLLTNKCNSKCKYCKKWEKDIRDMDTGGILSLIDELSYLGTKIISFGGGEPLLREDIGEIINYAKRKNIFTILNSNGFLVPEKIDEIKKSDLLVISLDGMENVHDTLRGKNSYSKAVNAIKLLKSEGINVWTSTTLARYNTDISSVNFLLDNAKEMGFSTIFQPFLPDPNLSAKDIKLLLPDPGDYREVINFLIYQKGIGAPIINSKEYLRYIYDYPNSKEKIKCFAGKFFCQINSNGDVYPCITKMGEIKTLNFLEVGFKEAFNNLPEVSCKCCWCYSQVEVNMLYSFNIPVIYDKLTLRIGE